MKIYKSFFSKDVDYDCEVVVYNLDKKNHERVLELTKQEKMEHIDE